MSSDCRDVSSPASKFGQMIGNYFEKAVLELISSHLSQKHPDYTVFEARGSTVRLEMLGGLPRQMDNVIALKNSTDPVALFETKWLKDARHHNDKGAWILQLREVRKNHTTIRGAVAVLAGYWTEGVGVMLQSEGGIKMILVATDEQIYSTLQEPLNDYLGANSFELNAREMRKSYRNPDLLLDLFCHLEETRKLKAKAVEWLNFERESDDDGTKITGGDLIKTALDELLAPLPDSPRIVGFEIALEIETGNIIYKSFEDIEEALEFIQTYHRDPKAILQEITPTLD